jgi:RsiW-degrading membrane proteinase PrsW (M82 family)
MFTTIGNFSLFATLLAFYLAGAAFYLVYRLCGKRKPWWILLLAAGMTVGLIFAPTFPWMLWFFRRFLPGDVFALSGRANVSFFTYLSTNFFGAGMLEELLKALPVFILTGIGLLFRDRWRDRIGVVEPLDGILIGAASAIGFTLTETLLQYVPETVQEVASQAGEGAGYFVGLQLLIPRILGSVSGHVAYSGYFGYFIGLCALQPKRWWLILPIGYLSSSGLHALWNASASVVNNRFVGAAILAVVGIFAYAFLAAAILKAREVSPTRSQNFSTHIKP